MASLLGCSLLQFQTETLPAFRQIQVPEPRLPTAFPLVLGNLTLIAGPRRGDPYSAPVRLYSHPMPQKPTARNRSRLQAVASTKHDSYSVKISGPFLVIATV